RRRERRAASAWTPARRGAACARSRQILAADEQDVGARGLGGRLHALPDLGGEIAPTIGDGIPESQGLGRGFRHAALGLVIVDGVARVAAEGDEKEAGETVELHEAREDAAAIQEAGVLDEHGAAPTRQVRPAGDGHRFLLAGHIHHADGGRAAHLLHELADPGVRHRGRDGPARSVVAGDVLAPFGFHTAHRPTATTATQATATASSTRATSTTRMADERRTSSTSLPIQVSGTEAAMVTPALSRPATIWRAPVMSASGEHRHAD